MDSPLPARVQARSGALSRLVRGVHKSVPGAVQETASIFVEIGGSYLTQIRGLFPRRCVSSVQSDFSGSVKEV